MDFQLSDEQLQLKKTVREFAEREIALNAEIAKAAGDVATEESLREQLITERRKLQAELEDKKEQARAKQ